jgi:monovalent cation:H+ antiporter, CPA1 family
MGWVSKVLILSVTDPVYKELLLEMTYFVVFSIVVQGLTKSKLANRVLNVEPEKKSA